MGFNSVFTGLNCQRSVSYYCTSRQRVKENQTLSCSVYLLHSLLFIYFFFACGSSIPFWLMASPYGASRSHSDTPHLVGVRWTSGQPVAETSTDKTQPSLEMNFYDTDGVRTQNHNKRAAADPRFRSCCHCDRCVEDLNFSPRCETRIQVSASFPNESYANDNFN